MYEMTLIERAEAIANILDETSPKTIDFLEQSSPFELLVAAVLSAQTTDRQVNAVVPDLFGAYPDAFHLATADIEEVMKIIKSTGFYRVKAAHIITLSRQLVEYHNGEVPMNMNDLTALSGVGRKVANVILGKLSDYPAIIVDTHFGRVVQRLALVTSSDPVVIERQIIDLINPESRYRFSMTVNLHGRTICRARKSECGICKLCSLCPSCIPV